MKHYNLDRKFLVEALEELLSDEFDSSELVYLNDDEIILRIISAGKWYQEEYNKQLYED